MPKAHASRTAALAEVEPVTTTLSGLESLANDLSTDLEQRIKGKVATAIAETTKTLADSKETVKSLQTELKEAKDNISDHVQNLKSLREELEESEKSVRDQLLISHDMKNKIDELEVRKVWLEDENKDLQAQLKQSLVGKAYFQARFAQLQDEMKEMQAKVDQGAKDADLASIARALARHDGPERWNSFLSMVERLRGLI